MTEADLQAYLHRQIPLSAAMQVSVVSATLDSVVLSAPLEPNINHKHGVRRQRVGARHPCRLSIVHLRLTAEGLDSEVVIQSNQMDYERPILGTITAASSLADPSAWLIFTKLLARRKRARIEARSVLTYEGEVAGNLTGRFVAFLNGHDR